LKKKTQRDPEERRRGGGDRLKMGPQKPLGLSGAGARKQGGHLGGLGGVELVCPERAPPNEFAIQHILQKFMRARGEQSAGRDG